MNLFFILIISLLSWYHWSDAVWIEEAKQKLRSRAAESRRRRAQQMLESLSDVSTSGSQRNFEEDEDEDMSIIDDKSVESFSKSVETLNEDEEIEELLASNVLRQRKPGQFIEVASVTDSSTC